MTIFDTRFPQGALKLGEVMLERYGEQSFAMIVDEGGVFGDLGLGSPFALVGTTENGYLDVHVTVSTPGGHSSLPPEHTVRLPLPNPDHQAHSLPLA